MSGLNSSIFDVLKLKVTGNARLESFLKQVLLMEYDSQVPFDKRKDFVLELTDSYRDQEE